MRMRNRGIHIITGLFLLFISGSINAQNWQAVNSAFTYNFTSEPDDGIVYTIYADSADFDGQDSTLWLNRVVKDNEEGTEEYGIYEQAFYNQPQFLMKDVEVNDTAAVFRHPEIFVLPYSVPVTGQWTFDEVNGITATLGYEADSAFFGITDSIRVIELSTGDTIIQSKDHGILRFDAIYEDAAYHLAGIEDLAGQQVMDYSDIFDYQPGDIYEYEETELDPGSDRGRFIRMTILQRTDNPPVITYEILKQVNNWIRWGYAGNTPVEERITSVINLNYNYNPDNIENGYTGQLVQMFDVDWSDYNLSKIHVDHSYKGLLTKTAGSEEKMDFFMITDSINHLMVRSYYSYGDVYMVTRVFASGLGMVHYGVSDFEYGLRKELTAWIKDGEQTGTFRNDDIYLSEIGREVNTPVTVYPNPCADMLHVGLPEGMHSDRITIMDLTGKLLMYSENNNSLDISQLSPGIYLVGIEADGQHIIRKIIKE